MLDDLFKNLGKAIHDLFQTGGRLTEESEEFIRGILADQFDSLKDQVTEIVKGALSDMAERIAELEELLNEKEKAVKKAVAVKKSAG